ncbi:unnamed protein product [Lepeophtheirus salmonis]|uniref:(salmon louse) hypothetical protein n=1 Tax=Lepeophtheirus salmonis TaxID=72036 RepID=A0A7R8CPB2_LEPSM|nr:unnamed protein product [Lepeophtheirus salmonis]CAF2881349.1 unnamed protein product [Lepeophtheirus salmonis]
MLRFITLLVYAQVLPMGKVQVESGLNKLATRVELVPVPLLLHEELSDYDVADFQTWDLLIQHIPPQLKDGHTLPINYKQQETGVQFSVEILGLRNALNSNTSTILRIQAVKFLGVATETELVEALKPFKEKATKVGYVPSIGIRIASINTLLLTE